MGSNGTVAPLTLVRSVTAVEVGDASAASSSTEGIAEGTPNVGNSAELAALAGQALAAYIASGPAGSASIRFSQGPMRTNAYEKMLSQNLKKAVRERQDAGVPLDPYDNLLVAMLEHQGKPRFGV